MRLTLSFVIALGGATGLWWQQDLRASAQLSVIILIFWGVAVAALVPTQAQASWKMVASAVLIRTILWMIPPGLSDDVFRYVWEGRVWRAGLSPFVLAPDAPELVFLRDAGWEQVNHKEISTIYPPLAQLFAYLLAPWGVTGWKGVMGIFDVGTVILLGKRSGRAGWLWALGPLGAVESAGSGHLEGAGVFFLVAALSGGILGGVFAWLGAMVKLLPGVLLLRLVPWRWLWVPGLAMGLAVGAMGGEGLGRGFGAYEAHWSFNSSIYALLRVVTDQDLLVRRGLQLLGIGVSLGILLRSHNPARIALYVCGAFVCLSPTVHPWYVLWVLAVARWQRVGGAWEWLAATIPLSYWVLSTYDPILQSWQEPVWVVWVVYPVFYGLLIYEGVRRIFLPSPLPCW